MDAMGKVMENMSPDDIASMQQMMASGTMPTASSLASDPKTIHHTLEMLKSMDEETVIQMIRSSGMCADEDRVRHCLCIPVNSHQECASGSRDRAADERHESSSDGDACQGSGFCTEKL